jgi:apolipoprotein N-acyltransferase
VHAPLKWSLPFVFAILFWAAWAPLDLGFLGWVALVPLLVYAKRTSGAKSFFVAWLAGAVAFGAGFHWVRYTVPVGPLFLGLYKGLYVALFVVAIRRLGALWTPVVWTALEYLRGNLMGGLPWFLLGYTQHESLRLVQVADLGGVWLVTALVALVNGALVDGRRPARFAAAAAVVAAFAYGAIRMPLVGLEDGPKVAVVQPNIPQDLKTLTIDRPEQALENYRKHLELTLRVADEEPDLIVWPEAAIYTGLVWDVRGKDWVRHLPWYERVVAPAREAGAKTLLGLLVVDREGQKYSYTNSAVLVEREGTIGGRYDKVHLVPFSEFTPLVSTFPRMKDLIQRISGLRLEDMRAGNGFPLWEAGGRKFGTQICFEAIFPEISREIARKGGAFTVNISNDGWFRDSGELDQMLAMARFRAIENRTHVIRATNTGISAFIEPTGRHQAVLEVGGRRKEVAGTLSARVKVTGSTSLFRAWGNWVGQMAVGAAAAGLAWSILVDRRKKLA